MLEFPFFVLWALNCISDNPLMGVAKLNPNGNSRDKIRPFEVMGPFHVYGSLVE